MESKDGFVDLSFASSGPLRGQELAQGLVASAKQVGSSARNVLEESSLADLAKYLDSEFSRKIARSQVEYIFAAALAGGVYAAENLPNRLRKVSPELHGERLTELCCEIEALISERKSTIDSIRTTVNSVTSIFGELLKDDLLSETDQKKSRLRDFEEERKKLLARKVSNYEEFLKWIDECIVLYRKISEYRSEKITKEVSSKDDESRDLISAKRKKGFVSTRSIDTYEKRVGDFVSEFVSVNKRRKPRNSQSIMEAINPFKAHVPSLPSIRSVIEANFKETSKSKYLQNLDAYEAKEGSKQTQELEHFIDNRSIKITFSAKIISDSVDQVLNSLRAQLNSKRVDGKAKHRIGDSFLSIEVPGIKKGDIEEIAEVLRLNQKR